MPMTENGFMEPDNDDRSDFAEAALTTYMDLTKSDMDTAVRDLIGDLGHFFDRAVKGGVGHDFKQEVEWAYGTYAAEKHEAENDLPPVSTHFAFELVEA